MMFDMATIFVFLQLLGLVIGFGIPWSERRCTRSLSATSYFPPAEEETVVRVGRFEVHAYEQERELSSLDPLRILMQDIASGWGNGKHPTTQLCLECINDAVKPGDLVLDYGTGSGILSILSMRLGARRCYAVDIDEDSLRAAERNCQLNGYRVPEDVDVTHTKYVYIGNDRFEDLADVTVANILPGPLSRLVAPLWGLSKPGGLLILSGMRPSELNAIRGIYAPFVDLDTERVLQQSHEIFGPWVAWTVRWSVMSAEDSRLARDRLTEASMN